MSTILILNGPNLNMLGTREPDIYGSETLDDIAAACEAHAGTHSITLDFRQSNTEGELVDWIQQASERFDGLIINAGAYTHTSVAIHDALKLLSIPIVEVHLSNVFAREAFRHHSYISSLAAGVICGFGSKSYLLAIDGLADRLAKGHA